MLNRLEGAGLLTNLEDGRQVIDLDSKRRVIMTKSDGSSLYITRDISAGLDRIKSFNPDKILYVVENAQSNHFSGRIFYIFLEIEFL